MHFDLTVIGTGPGGHVFARMGIGVGAPKLDLSRMMALKQEAVDGNTKGVEFLFKKNKITAFQGTGRIVGAGNVGLELGSVWRRLGSKVTVIEFLDRILPGIDEEIAKQFQRLLRKQGFAIKLASKVTGVETAKNGLKVAVEPVKGGAAET